MTTIEPALDLHPALRSTTDPRLSWCADFCTAERPQWTPRELRDLTWTVAWLNCPDLCRRWPGTCLSSVGGRGWR